ncbi:uncharacterized protein LOC113088784 [Carassius auratus]|uniref:Uncharacterized protein LOC113088784 n=1 Tax=Carassius auratus TaxID=7957 RepID=A0A6P6NSZ7_CARAU|nr:uncharacterized protein LOC113088784 [Carassius auratus]
MASRGTKREADEEKDKDTVCGYIHNVTECRISLYKRVKLFNAVIQTDRDEFRNMAIFAAEKHTTFKQAEKNKSPVKLSNVSKRVSSQGEGYDVQCGRATEVNVVERLPFSFKQPLDSGIRSLAEVKAMAPKQQVSAVVGRVVHVSQCTETVEFQGASIEAQSCYLEDTSGTIKIQLWESLIGKLDFGRTYKLTNVSTRVFAGSMYLTTSRRTEIQQVAPLHGLNDVIQFRVDEGQVVVMEGSITSVEVALSHRCSRCNAWQQDFEKRGKFHRCFRCKRLQLVEAFQPTVNASVTFVGEFGEKELTLSNSVIKRYF